jgi:hypothetical protein
MLKSKEMIVPIERKLLSDDQMKGMADIWARPPLDTIGRCKNADCDHHGTLEPDGQCLWCAGRERKRRAALKDKE